MMPLAASVCPECGHAFPQKEREAKICGEASTLDVISGEVKTETREVEFTEYAPWTKRGAPAGSPRTVRVTYWCGLNERYSEWLCPEHVGYARRKFEKWYLDRVGLDETAIPDTVDEFIDREGEGKVRGTKEITVRTVSGSKWPEVVASVPGDFPPPTPSGGEGPDPADIDYDSLPF